MREVLTAIVPCRSGSERIPEKNTRAFSPEGTSLLEIKLRQLEKVQAVESIVISTNDPKVISITENLKIEKARIDRRPEALCASETSIENLARHFGNVISGHTFLWTHVTSPFFGSLDTARAVDAYFKLDTDVHDSLVAIEPIYDFCFFEGKPINFGKLKSFWPRTQDLEPVIRITSSVFMGPVSLLKEGNRLGRSPYLWETNGPRALDIDWPHDFDLAASLAKFKPSALR